MSSDSKRTSSPRATTLPTMVGVPAIGADGKPSQPPGGLPVPSATPSAPADNSLDWPDFDAAEVPTDHGVAPVAPIKPAPKPAAPAAPPPPRARIPTPRRGLTPVKGRATLLLDGHEVPPRTQEDAYAPPPIVVPAPGTHAPKAVTQAPPWGEGAAHTPGIPKNPSAPRNLGAPIGSHDPEELSGSLLLPDPDGSGAVEELSGSVFLPVLEPPRAPRHSPPPPPLQKKPSLSPPPPRKPSLSIPAAKPLAPPAPHAPRPPTPKPPEAAPKASPSGSRLSPAPPFVAPSAKPPPVVNGAGTTPVAPAIGPVVRPVVRPPPAPSSADPLAAALGMPSPPSSASLLPEATPPIEAEAKVEIKDESSSKGAGPSFTPPSLDPSGLPPDVPVPEWLPNPLRSSQFPSIPETETAVEGAVQKRAPTLPPPVNIRVETPSKSFLTGSPSKHDVLGSFLRSGVLRGPRPKWFIPVVSVFGLVVLLGTIGLIVRLASKRPSEVEDGQKSSTSRRTPVATASTAAAASIDSATPSSPVTHSPAPAPAPLTLSNKPCILAGDLHVVAPSAVVSAGVEVVAVESGIALGFASSDRDAMAVLIDPTTLAAVSTTKLHANDPIRRVNLTQASGKLSIVADADRKLDKVHGRRTVVGDSPFELGESDGHLVATTKGGGPATATKLFALEGDGVVEALRAVPVPGAPSPTYAVTFRRGASIWVGAVTGGEKPAPKGTLTRLTGLGPKVGSPTIAASGNTIFVAWADRASATDSWGVRTVAFAADAAPGTPQTFSAQGGLGGHLLAPSVAAVPGGRFLLVWTEGPSATQVRAQTLGSDGAPLGNNFAISGEGTNGQGQAAVGADGHGVAAFLASKRPKAFEVAAASLACPM